jgi:1-acyl-sn-glycerol-3-phosphate acyltransferase
MKRTSKIGEWSLGYNILRWGINPAFNLYYKKISVINRHKIKVDGPFIFAPNHQGTLMDPLAVIFGFKTQIVFLARADIFKKPLIAKILHFIRILPAYRSRDGRDNLLKNDEIFDLTVQILHNNKTPLCLFPEGSHGNKRRLRQLVKGMFRIAFQTQEEYGSKPFVKIIPIGIDYGHYQKFRSTQLVVAGDPIEVCEFWQEYTENPAVAINMLRDKLSEEMRKLMIDIQIEEYYDLYMGLRSIYNTNMCKRIGLEKKRLYNQFQADKRMIGTLDNCLQQNQPEIEALNQIFIEYTALRKQLNYREWVSEKTGYSIIGNIAALLFSIPAIPIFLLGLFNNWPHFFIPPWKFKNIKDPQFFSTAKWVMGFFMFPLYFIPLALLALIFLPFWWLKVLYIVTFIPSGIFALGYRNFVVKSIARIRYSFKIQRKDQSTIRLREFHEQIICAVDKIMEKYS